MTADDVNHLFITKRRVEQVHLMSQKQSSSCDYF